MRINGSSQSSVGGGISSGQYVSPMFFKNVISKGYENFDDLSPVEGTLIPTNYANPDMQNAVDLAFTEINDLYPEASGPIETDEFLNFKVPTFAKYLETKKIIISPHGSLNVDLEGYDTQASDGTHPKIFLPDTQKIGIVWTVQFGANYKFYFKIGDRTSGKIVWGDPHEVTGILAKSNDIFWLVEKVDTDKFMIVYSDANNSDRLSAVVATLTGTSLNTVGTVFQIDTATSQQIVFLEHCSTNKLLLCWNTAATACILSVSGTTVTKGTNADISLSAAAGSTPIAKRLSNNTLLLCVPEVTNNGNIYSAILTTPATTITLGAEDVANTSTIAVHYPLALFNITTTSSYLWFRSTGSAYYCWHITNNGATTDITATGVGGSFSGVDSNDRFLGNMYDGKIYRIDNQVSVNTIYRYSSAGVLEDSFQPEQPLSWPSVSQNQAAHKTKDLEDGLSVAFSNDDGKAALMHSVSPGNDFDIDVNGESAYSNIGSDTFGLILDIPKILSKQTIEIKITNKSTDPRLFTVDKLIVTVQ